MEPGLSSRSTSRRRPPLHHHRHQYWRSAGRRAPPPASATWRRRRRRRPVSSRGTAQPVLGAIDIDRPYHHDAAIASCGLHGRQSAKIKNSRRPVASRTPAELSPAAATSLSTKHSPTPRRVAHGNALLYCY